MPKVAFLLNYFIDNNTTYSKSQEWKDSVGTPFEQSIRNHGMVQ